MPFSTETERAWVDIDLDALVRNAGRYQALVGVPLLPMIKADAYGLGAIPVARALQPLRPVGWGVATTGEGRSLRKAGFHEPIVVFTPLDAGRLAGHREAGLRPIIGDLAALEAWLGASGDPFHLEIDTGMARSGIRWDAATDLARAGELLRNRSSWEGCFTHFHSPESDPAATATQVARFREALAVLGTRPALLHAASSGGGCLGPSCTFDAARPGVALYGAVVPGLEIEPVVAVRARVVSLRRVLAGDTVSYGATWTAARPTTIATLAAGYADGIKRVLSNVGEVELHGVRCPIVGRVTMDFTMIDVGETPVSVGDVATFFGGVISVEEMASKAGTIPYELFTALGPRLPRRYHRCP